MGLTVKFHLCGFTLHFVLPFKVSTEIYRNVNQPSLSILLCSAGTTCSSLYLEEGSLTTRAPNAGWRTIWTTQVKSSRSLVSKFGQIVGKMTSEMNALSPLPPFSFSFRLQSVAGQCGFCVVSGHGG